MSVSTNDDPTHLEYLGVTDTELVVRLRLPTNLHQKVFQAPDGTAYQETILSKEQGLKLYDHMHQAFFGGEPTEDTRIEKIEGALRVLDGQGITDEEFIVLVRQYLKMKRRRRRS